MKKNKLNFNADLDTNMANMWANMFASTQKHLGLSGLVLNSKHPGLYLINEIPKIEELDHNLIGARIIPNWQLQDLEAFGNCFYDAILDQTQLINHPFLATVPEGTLARDSLRLRIQGNQFADMLWANDDDIESILREFPEIVLAIADTRIPQAGFVLRYLDASQSITSTEVDARVNQILADPSRRILRIAATGDHFFFSTCASNVNNRSIINNICRSKYTSKSKCSYATSI